MNQAALYQRLQDKPDYWNYLYRFGYLITDSEETYTARYFFLKNWSTSKVQNFNFWIHPDQKLFLHSQGSSTYFLIGHCYNPIQMVADEPSILKALAQAHSSGHTDYCRLLSELTGVFVTGYVSEGAITLFGDAAGMLMAYYGIANGKTFISSHSDFLGQLNELPQSTYVQRLVNYRFYPLFGYFLPGDLSPYDAFKRLVPNHSLTIQNQSCRINRFYPIEDWDHLQASLSLGERAEQSAQILKNTMALIPQKWEKPAISLTGGCDSKTTLACTIGQYEHYSYFSYISQEAERLDAEGAHTICDALHLPHTIHSIPDSSDSYTDLELVRDIIAANQGNIGKLGAREVQKRIYFADTHAFDVEVKSWVSEVARAYYHKRFAKKAFPAKPTPRYLTTLYKVFAHDRKLVKQTDRIFADYIEKYLPEEQLYGWNWIDIFFWEFRVSAWNGLVITGEHRYSFDITIPYNNRRLLELMLAAPVDTRMTDTLYAKIRALTSPTIDASGVSITNMKHTENRAKMERFYLEAHAKLPF